MIDLIKICACEPCRLAFERVLLIAEQKRVRIKGRVRIRISTVVDGVWNLFPGDHHQTAVLFGNILAFPENDFAQTKTDLICLDPDIAAGQLLHGTIIVAGSKDDIPLVGVAWHQIFPAEAFSLVHLRRIRI